MNKTLGLSIILKNEKENIRKNLLTFYNLFNDVKIIDTGSNDGTIELLKINNKTYISYNLDQKNEHSLIQARNLSITLNRSDWILVLDADEFITIEDINKIKKYINNNNDLDGYFIKFLDYRYGNPFEDYKLCLFKKNIYFEGYVHANPQSFFRKNNLKADFLEKIQIHHKPTLFSPKKIEKYISQMLYGLGQENNNTRYLWFLGYSFFKNNQNKDARKYLKLSLNTFSNYYPVETINAGIILSYIYYLEGNIVESLDTINLTIDFYNKFKNDFEVKINFRMKNTIYKIKENLLKNKKIDFIYEFMY